MAMGVAIAMAMTDGDDEDDAMSMGSHFLAGSLPIRITTAL